MEFKGTKGEWFVKNLNKSAFETDIYCGKVRIAQAKHYNNGKHYNDGDLGFKNDPKKKEGQANAQLIATAPELLEALKDLVWLIDNHALDDELRESINTRAKKAINKALGL